MHARFLTCAACLAVLVFAASPPELIAQNQNLALTGQVASAKEGAMEGVLVSAKKTGSIQTDTVVSDRQGRHRFPRARLEPGEYALRIRAIGYDLDAPASVTVSSGKTTTADLALRP